MVKQASSHPQPDWHKADARVLGQILAAQNIVFALPDTTRIAEFYAQTLMSIPGIAACRVCLGNKSAQAGNLPSDGCAECEAWRYFAGEDGALAPANANFKCSLADQPDMRLVAIDSYQHHFGAFVFKLKDAVVFEVYQPFISNLSNYVALILENRWQKDLLQKARAELERKVAERTHDLTIANEALDAARLAALNMMRDAVEARQHAEQANADLQHEVAERQRADEEIRRLNQELEQRVADRTAQLEASNKELEAFAYSVSHDLRAPLRHIDGFLELLQQRITATLDKRGQHYMTNISESAQRMGVLIDDLLSFSRMGRHELARQSVDLNSLVREVIDELAPEAAARSIHWHIADLPVITGDRAMLRMVLVNLIANAMKFTRLRAVAEIDIDFANEANETIVFVHDNGVGFDMQYAEKLFGVFQRLHRADEFEGTGIGLANVRRIINRHGGRTWAHGEVDQGATFYFALPKSIQQREGRTSR